MSRRAGPGILPWPLDQTGPHRIQFYVADRCQQVLLIERV